METNCMVVYEYSAKAFPRLEYNYKSFQQFTKRKLPHYYIHCDNFHVITAGDTFKGNLRLISKKRASKIETDLNEFYLQGTVLWQSIPLVYFMKQDESLINARTRVEEISSQIKDAFPWHRCVVITHDAKEKQETWQTAQGINCVNVKYSKEKIRQAVSTILETPLFETLRKIHNDETITDMQTCLEVQTLLKHERLIWKSEITSTCYQTVPEAIVDVLKGRSEITAFGIWQDQFFVFLKTCTKLQSEINSEIQKTDGVFFNKMTPRFVYTDTFGSSAFIKQGDALYRKYKTPDLSQGASLSCKENFGTVGALLRNAFSMEKVYGLTSFHLFNTKNIEAFTKKNDGSLDRCGKCILSFERPDVAFIEFENKVIDDCDTKFHDENDIPRNISVHHDSLATLGKVHKKGAVSQWTEGMIISPDTYAKMAEGDYLTQCIVIEGTSSPFSVPGDSGSIIFTHSFDHSRLEAVGIVAAGNLEIRDRTWSEQIGRQECDMEKLTLAFKLQPGFDKARESKPSFKFIFEEVESSASESDDD